MSVRPAIEIRVLGPLEVRRSGLPVAVPGAKPRALLTMLGLQAGTVVPGDVLQTALWGDSPPRTAHKALQTHVSALRRALGPEIVFSRGGGWQLGVDVTDATSFDESVRAAGSAAANGAAPDAAAHFSAALDVWRGPPHHPNTPRARA
jgi:DNA-binding SARP family transcriptional activator